MNSTRERLIEEGLKSLIVNGFDGIGLNAILAAAKVPKGSFYYFFPSKEAFATAVIDAYEMQYTAMRKGFFTDTAHSPLTRLLRYFDAVEAMHLAEAPLAGCLYGVLSQTAAARSPEFRARLATIFQSWQTQMAELLEEAKAQGELAPEINCTEVAAFLIDAYEGLLVRMKVGGDAKAFARFRRLVLDPLCGRQGMAKTAETADFMGGQRS